MSHPASPNGPVLEHLPGERRRAPWPAPAMAGAIVVWLVLLAPLLIATAPLWLLFLIGWAIWGWPPVCIGAGRIGYLLQQIWTAEPPPPGLPVLHRLWFTVVCVRTLLMNPVKGCAWHLDELIYGRRLDAVRIEAPLIKISAARSGSTQLARYLEDDPNLIAPPFIKFAFPYRWLWWLAGQTLGRVISPDRARALIAAIQHPEFIERHEADPLRTDTFEATFYFLQLKQLQIFLGPDCVARDINLAVATARDQILWDETFVELFDRIARKIMLDARPGADDRWPRYYAKGHFLAAADALARRYPDARFLTVVRHPTKRLRSMINFLRVNPLGQVQGPPPFAWIGPGLARAETDYCRAEQAWFSRDDGVRRCVLRFKDYVADLEGTMTRVYRECLDTEVLPDYVPREHAPRDRKNYSLNRELPQMGVDPEAFEAGLTDYIAWVRGEG